MRFWNMWWSMPNWNILEHHRITDFHLQQSSISIQIMTRLLKFRDNYLHLPITVVRLFKYNVHFPSLGIVRKFTVCWDGLFPISHPHCWKPTELSELQELTVNNRLTWFVFFRNWVLWQTQHERNKQSRWLTGTRNALDWKWLDLSQMVFVWVYPLIVIKNGKMGMESPYGNGKSHFNAHLVRGIFQPWQWELQGLRLAMLNQ